MPLKSSAYRQFECETALRSHRTLPSVKYLQHLLRALPAAADLPRRTKHASSRQTRLTHLYSRSSGLVATAVVYADPSNQPTLPMPPAWFRVGP